MRRFVLVGGVGGEGRGYRLMTMSSCACACACGDVVCVRSQV
jgi:hypothetical protein